MARQSMNMGFNLFAMALILILTFMSMLATAAPASDLTKRDTRIEYNDYTITYYDTPLKPTVDDTATVGDAVSVKATTAVSMSIVLCTDSPLYYGKCMTLSLARDGCVDLLPGTPWDNAISSIGIQTQTALCKVWRGHACEGNDGTFVNEGDTSRDTFKLAPWNDDISSIACYWDPRGVIGEWDV